MPTAIDCDGCATHDSIGLVFRRLLRKFFTQLSEGRGASDAANAFARHPPLAYYAYLSLQILSEKKVRVLDEHLPWSDFFGQQGPYMNGGISALEAESDRLAKVMISLIAASPPAATAATEEVDVLLARFHTLNSARDADNVTDGHDEL